MTIIVTGGAGFIGSNFIFYLMDHHPEDRIVCIDKLTYAGNLSTLAPVLETSATARPFTVSLKRRSPISS